jgi:hypothetical protein
MKNNCKNYFISNVKIIAARRALRLLPKLCGELDASPEWKAKRTWTAQPSEGYW